MIHFVIWIKNLDKDYQWFKIVISKNYITFDSSMEVYKHSQSYRLNVYGSLQIMAKTLMSDFMVFGVRALGR